MSAFFKCPRCGAESHNPNDMFEGYCGRCHDWTAKGLEEISAAEIPPILGRTRTGIIHDGERTWVMVEHYAEDATTLLLRCRMDLNAAYWFTRMLLDTTSKAIEDST